jgi:beta-galactosidase GanA
MMEEGGYAGGRWIPGRRMNGDENHQGRHLYLPGREFGIQRVRLYTFK